MRLIYEASKIEVRVSDVIDLGEGVNAVVTKIEAPHKPSSTGRVYVRRYGSKFDSGYFPSVIGAVWIERGDE